MTSTAEDVAAQLLPEEPAPLRQSRPLGGEELTLTLQATPIQLRELFRLRDEVQVNILTTKNVRSNVFA